MNHEAFFENFEELVDAPNSVQKMRELILQLAVQGKLVPHNQNEESASILLHKIKNEKEQLIREKNIKKSNPITAIESNEIPYRLSNGWEWVHLDQISNMVHYGYTASANHNLKDVRLLRITDIQKNKVNWDSVPGCEINGNILDNYKLNDGDLLIARTGGTIGKSYLVDNIPICAVFASYLIRIIPSSFIQSEYFKLFLDSPLYWNQLYAKSMGTGQPNVNGTSLKSLIVPLPPLEEQKRIVAKVDQLMALCDELEARQQKKHTKRILLNNAALDKLLTAPTPEEFAQHWQRICDNFDLLYDAPETVGQMRQAILQLAVQGKLVVQDEGDEPATVLLEEIKGEKEQLVKDKKINKIKSLPPIKENEISYKLPDKWIWARLGDALLKVTDGTHHSPPNGPKGEFKYITAKNIKSEGIKLSNITYVSATVHEEIYGRCDPEPGNILYIKDGATTGIVTINDLNEQFSMLSSVALLKNPSKIYNRYLLYVLRSPYFYSLMRDDMSGVAITRVTLTKLNRALIPLAPFKEQKRIVAKVDQLMALCDELEAGLVQAQTEGGRLMEAVVHHVLAE